MENEGRSNNEIEIKNETLTNTQKEEEYLSTQKLRALNQLRSKGRFVKKSVLEKKLNFVANMKEHHLAKKSKEAEKAYLRKKEKKAYYQVEGRRLVDLDVLAEELWCNTCEKPLSLRHIVSEQKYGFASVLKVKCTVCGLIYVVHTDKYLKKEKKFSSNVDAARGMLDTGLTTSQFNKFFSSVNVPQASRGTLKNYEKFVEKQKEEATNISCCNNDNSNVNNEK